MGELAVHLFKSADTLTSIEMQTLFVSGLCTFCLLQPNKSDSILVQLLYLQLPKVVCHEEKKLLHVFSKDERDFSKRMQIVFSSLPSQGLQHSTGLVN